MGEAVDIDAIKDLLASRDDPDYPISRTKPAAGGDVMGYTAGSVIYVLGRRSYLEVAAGPPSETTYRRVDFASEYPSRAVARAS